MNAYFRRISPLQIAFSITMLAVVFALIASGQHTAAFLIAPGVVADIDEIAAQFATKCSEMATLHDKLKGQHEEIKGKLDGNETITQSLKTAIDDVLSKFNETKAVVDEMEQKLSQRVKDAQADEKTWGTQFVESDAFKAKAAEAGRLSGKRFGVLQSEVKQVTSAAAGGLLRRPMRDSEIVSLGRERRVMRDLLNTIPTQEAVIEYARQTTRTNNAAPVAEGGQKPYSDYAWDVTSVNVRTIAHLTKITRQAMDDAPRLVGEIDLEMRYGLGFVEERQFLYGNGTGQNLHGIVPQATAFVVPAQWEASALATRIDVLRLAILQVSLGLVPADGIVLNEIDWALIELIKTTDGAYLFSQPQGSVSPRMWSLPVVATPAMLAGDFLVGSFKMGATVYDRMGVEVLISTENDKDFELNLATMRAEERVALAVKRPYAFVTGDFAAAVAALKVTSEP